VKSHIDFYTTFIHLVGRPIFTFSTVPTSSPTFVPQLNPPDSISLSDTSSFVLISNSSFSRSFVLNLFFLRQRDYNSNLPFQVSRFAHLQKPCEICYEEPGGAPCIFELATVLNLTKSACFLTVIYYILHIVDVIVMCSSTSMYTFKLISTLQRLLQFHL